MLSHHFNAAVEAAAAAVPAYVLLRDTTAKGTGLVSCAVSKAVSASKCMSVRGSGDVVCNVFMLIYIYIYI